MQKRFALFATALMAVVLVGAGCSTTTDTGTTDATETSEVTMEADGDSVALHTLELINDELYDGETGYKYVTITEEEGTCSELGLTEFTYHWDDLSQYHAGEVTGVTENSVVTLGTTENTMAFYTIPTDSGTATCEFTVDSEAFTGTCSAGGAEICTGTFSGMAY